MNVADWIDRVEVINECLTLLDKEADKLSERKTICKVISNNTYPKKHGKGISFERRRTGQDAESS